MEYIFGPVFVFISLGALLVGLAMAIACIFAFFACYIFIAIDTAKYVARKSAGRWGFVGLLVILISLVMGFLWGAKLLKIALLLMWLFAPIVRLSAHYWSKRGATGWTMRDIRYAWLLAPVTSVHLLCLPIALLWTAHAVGGCHHRECQSLEFSDFFSAPRAGPIRGLK